jgi:hypothetical protein
LSLRFNPVWIVLPRIRRFVVAGLLQLALASTAALLIAALPSGTALAQGQSDRLGQQLGTAPKLPAAPAKTGKNNSANEPIRTPLTVRVGQSVELRAGASIFTVDRQAAPLLFKLSQKPVCGKTWETSQGIVLQPTADCAGQTLDFDYEVTVADAPVDQRDAVRVAVQALVQSGIESCGIPNAPYEFVSIPAGSYSLQNMPGQLTDISGLLGSATVTVDSFCISEEVIPASEMAAFLAEQEVAQKRTLFPEALEDSLPLSSQVEMGRAVRPPALGVSHRMANGYAQRQSTLMDRPLRLPRLEQYVVAAVYLARQQPDAPSTQSFLVSLRGGMMEWTDTPCTLSQGTFIAVGTRQQSGMFDKYCYEASQKLARMSFRLVSPSALKNGLNAR